MRPTLPTRRPIEAAPILPPVAQCEPVFYPRPDHAVAISIRHAFHIRYDSDGFFQPHACGIAPAVLAPLRLED